MMQLCITDHPSAYCALYGKNFSLSLGGGGDCCNWFRLRSFTVKESVTVRFLAEHSCDHTLIAPGKQHPRFYRENYVKFLQYSVRVLNVLIWILNQLSIKSFIQSFSVVTSTGSGTVNWSCCTEETVASTMRMFSVKCFHPRHLWWIVKILRGSVNILCRYSSRPPQFLPPPGGHWACGTIVNYWINS
jgi:hypothetical protein